MSKQPAFLLLAAAIFSSVTAALTYPASAETKVYIHKDRDVRVIRRDDDDRNIRIIRRHDDDRDIRIIRPNRRVVIRDDNDDKIIRVYRRPISRNIRIRVEDD